MPRAKSKAKPKKKAKSRVNEAGNYTKPSLRKRIFNRISTQGKKATGERYLPEKAIKAMSDKEYAATTRKKRADTKKGKQFSKQPKKVAKKTVRHRK